MIGERVVAVNAANETPAYTLIDGRPKRRSGMLAHNDFELAVVGGGMGGLAAASLAARAGLRVILLESHTRLGGCAGWFDRGPYAFDAGATALMGLGPDEPIGGLCRAVGLDFRAVRTSSYRVVMPDRTLDIVPDADAFEAGSSRVFPDSSASAQRRFWRLQAWVGERLFDAASRVPRLPARAASDLAHDLRILGPLGLTAAATSVLTVNQVLRLLGLDRDRAFVALIAMLLQDTAQAGPETVPFANAAACLQAYRRGMSRPSGGMRALAEGLGDRVEALGGTVRRGTIVDRVEGDDRRGFVITTRRRDSITASQVVFNLPLDRAAALLGRPLDGALGRRERQSRAEWSAVTGYLAIDRDAVPDDAPLFHQVLRDHEAPIHGGNNVLVSLSPPGDASYGPGSVRVATLSTHVRPAAWADRDRPSHAARKKEHASFLLDALGRALPDAPSALVHAEFGTPRSFARYTRRALGAVGGPPVRRSNSNFLAVGADVFGPGAWVVGDSVFPGQGTMAVVLSAIRVIERITRRRWDDDDLRTPPSSLSSSPSQTAVRPHVSAGLVL
jgi:C-3',4' desaturase CrtD